MKIVGSRFGHYVDYRARVSAVFSIEGVRQNAKFSNAVRRGLNERQVRKLVISVAAVDCEIVVAPAAPIYR